MAEKKKKTKQKKYYYQYKVMGFYENNTFLEDVIYEEYFYENQLKEAFKTYEYYKRTRMGDIFKLIKIRNEVIKEESISNG